MLRDNLINKKEQNIGEKKPKYFYELTRNAAIKKVA